MGEFGVLKPVSYAGRHCRVRERLFMLLDMLKSSESGWHSGGKYYRLSELAVLGVPWLSYSYLKARLPILAGYGYLESRALTPKTGRPCLGYRLGNKGKERLQRCPEAVLTEAAAAILGAVPDLDPGRTYHVQPRSSGWSEVEEKQESVWPRVDVKRDNVTLNEQPKLNAFTPDVGVLYCLRMSNAAETRYLCGKPFESCYVTEFVPLGAVLLNNDDWNCTRQRD